MLWLQSATRWLPLLPAGDQLCDPMGKTAWYVMEIASAAQRQQLLTSVARVLQEVKEELAARPDSHLSTGGEGRSEQSCSAARPQPTAGTSGSAAGALREPCTQTAATSQPRVSAITAAAVQALYVGFFNSPGRFRPLN